MKANELRIGNLVYDGEKRICKVEQLSTDIHECKIYAIKGPITASYRYTGIPITEESLLKLGYKFYNGKTSGTLCRDFGGKLDIDFYEGKIQVKSHYEGYQMYRPIHNVKFVHQLQNIYFDLTGEEIS